MSKTIQLTKGYEAIVDDHWFEYLNQWKWTVLKSKTIIGAYAYRQQRINGKPTTILMHRVIAGASKRAVVDHVDGNTLNNQEHNLRVCTRAQNARNSKLNITNSTGYKGVSKSKKKKVFQVTIAICGKPTYLGYYSDPQEAARVYDKAAIKLFGEFAKTNESMGLL